MSEFRDLADRLTSVLDLELPPVSLAFVDEPPTGVDASVDAVPSSCAFWRQAERGVFFAAPEQHYNCPVGSMVMGFDLPEDVGEALGGLVESMCQQGYLSPEEAASIPSVGRASAGVVYGPLSQFPADPDVVLMWVSPKQAMLVNESAGGASWAATPTRVGSRPACAALPMAMADGRPTLSFGCIGMRTFTEIPEDRMLAAVPGASIAGFVASLEEMAQVNDAMQAFYEGRKAAVLA